MIEIMKAKGVHMIAIITVYVSMKRAIVNMVTPENVVRWRQTIEIKEYEWKKWCNTLS